MRIDVEEDRCNFSGLLVIDLRVQLMTSLACVTLWAWPRIPSGTHLLLIVAIHNYIYPASVTTVKTLGLILNHIYRLYQCNQGMLSKRFLETSLTSTISQLVSFFVLKTYTVKPLYCRHHETTAVCPDYRGVCISEASGIFMVGVANASHAVECYKVAF